MQCKISVIMPVYNTERYVERAIKSILNQTFTDFELIIVNDGSTDGSKEILDKYSKIYSRVRVINKQNEGLGYARNTGLEYVTGEYILFVDSDDYLDCLTLEDIYDLAMNNDADITVFNMRKVSENNNKVIMQSFLNIEDETISIQKIGIKKYFEKYFFNYKHGHEACNKLYKTSIIKSSGVIFDNNDEICSEDLLFNLKLIPFIEKITSTKTSYYNYMQRENSLMNTSYRQRLPKRYTNLINNYKNFIDELNNIKIDDEISVLYFNLLNAMFYNEKQKYGNSVKINFDILKVTNSKLFKTSMKNIALHKHCSQLLRQYGMSKYSIIIIRLFSLLTYINIRIGAIYWFLYVKVVR